MAANVKIAGRSVAHFAGKAYSHVKAKIAAIANIYDKNFLSAKEKSQNQSILSKLSATVASRNELASQNMPSLAASRRSASSTAHKTYTARTDADIASEAESMHAESYDKSVAKATDSYNTKAEKLDAKEEKGEARTAERLAKIEASEADALRTLQGRMIRQGMTGSSADTLGRAAITDAQNAARQAALDAFELERATIADARRALDTALAESVKNFELKRALNVEKAIATLAKKEQKLEADIIAYNTKADKASAASAKSAGRSVLKAYNKYLNKQKAETQLKLFEEAKEHYATLDKGSVGRMLVAEAQTLRGLLGRYYYDLIDFNNAR